MPPAGAGSDPCGVLAGPGEPISTIALTGSVDPSHAPRPQNESERLVFQQLYETLLRVDCAGRALPGLAADWRLDADGRTWLMTLRDDARFSDGSPVVAADVRAAWSVDGELRPDAARAVAGVAALDDRTLAVTLREPSAEAPRVLAHGDLAIARRASGSRWPLGTRQDRAAAAPEAGSAIVIRREQQPARRFVTASADPRDLLDTGVDLLVTREPAALSYAATLPQYQSLPLEWQRTEVLLLPARVGGAASLDEPSRHRLAADAARGEARGAVEPFWWQTLAACALPAPAARERAAFAPRIVYDAADSAARDLAERIVGLARAAATDGSPVVDALLPDRSRRSYDRAAALSGDALARARRLGNDAAYLVAVRRQPLDPCSEMRALLDQLPWLEPAAILPIADTRLRAIVRRGRSGLTADWDGLRLAAASGPGER
jgi:hypothetical protein